MSEEKKPTPTPKPKPAVTQAPKKAILAKPIQKNQTYMPPKGGNAGRKGGGGGGNRGR